MFFFSDSSITCFTFKHICDLFTESSSYILNVISWERGEPYYVRTYRLNLSDRLNFYNKIFDRKNNSRSTTAGQPGITHRNERSSYKGWLRNYMGTINWFYSQNPLGIRTMKKNVKWRIKYFFFVDMPFRTNVNEIKTWVKNKNDCFLWLFLSADAADCIWV
jgi:hypothetical protein